jgi:acetyl esterase
MPLDPKAQSLIDMFLESGLPPLPESTIEEARARADTIPQLLGEGPEVGSVEDITIPSPAGGIPARVYAPKGDVIGTVMYIHGGGWVVGSLDSFDPFCRFFTNETGCVVVSVDYRLAPEHPFPAGVDDCVTAVQWVAANRQQGLLAIAGDSSGANFAAVVARRARDAGGPEIAFQFLGCPVTNADFTTGSYVQHGGPEPVLLLGRADMEWFWNLYVPDEADRRNPDASPLLADDLSGLPPAYIVVAEHDPLRDEALAYAEKLKAAGVPVTVRKYDDQPHDFQIMINFLERADECVRDAASAMREALAGMSVA